MADITFSGLASGIDSGSIIEQMMEIESQPLTRLETEKAYLQNRLSAFEKFDSLLDTFNSFLDDFKTSDDFRSYSATAASEEFFSLSASSEAVNGSFQVEVQNLAQVQKDVGIGYASRSAQNFSSGTITIGTTDIAIDENDSLNDIAAKINEANSGDTPTGVSAAIINDGSENGYRLVLSGQDAGTTFSATVSGVIADGTALSFSNTQPAELAQIEVDGITITSKNNTFTDAVPGVTISLLKENEAGVSTNITVDTDNSAIKEKISEFVSNFNKILSFIDDQSDADWGKDASLQGVKRNLQALLTTSIGGSGNVNYLVEAGIKTNTETGLISVTDSVIDNLLDDDLESLEKLFIGEDGVDGISTLFQNYLDSITDRSNGILAAKKRSTDIGIRNLDNNIERMELRLEKREEILKMQFNAMEELVATMNSTSTYLSQQMTMLAGLSS